MYAARADYAREEEVKDQGYGSDTAFDGDACEQDERLGGRGKALGFVVAARAALPRVKLPAARRTEARKLRRQDAMSVSSGESSPSPPIASLAPSGAGVREDHAEGHAEARERRPPAVADNTADTGDTTDDDLVDLSDVALGFDELDACGDATDAALWVSTE